MDESARTTTSRRRPGRPAEGERAARREQLLDAAVELFMEHGYGGMNLDLLATRARVAKRTIYQQFGGKTDVFAAAVRRLSDRVVAPLDHPVSPAEEPRVDAELVAFGTRMVATLFADDAINLKRLIIGEAPRFPDLAATFYHHGTGRYVEALAERLVRFAEAGEIRQLDDPTEDAEHLFTLLLGEAHRRRLLALDPPPSADWVRAHVRAAVAVFLAAYRP